MASSRDRKWLLGLLLISFGGVNAICIAAENAASVGHVAPRLWVTWRGMEPDKGASAWFLMRFVRPDVQIREVESGLLDVGAGNPFDVPQANFRRTHQLSVYEQLVLAYPVDDPTVKRIGEIVHDIEINLWRPKKFPESALIQNASLELARIHGDGWIPVNCYVLWFDSIYSELKLHGSLNSVPVFPSACLASK